jgi:hypothetical protein
MTKRALFLSALVLFAPVTRVAGAPLISVPSRAGDSWLAARYDVMSLEAFLAGDKMCGAMFTLSVMASSTLTPFSGWDFFLKGNLKRLRDIAAAATEALKAAEDALAASDLYDEIRSECHKKQFGFARDWGWMGTYEGFLASEWKKAIDAAYTPHFEVRELTEFEEMTPVMYGVRPAKFRKRSRGLPNRGGGYNGYVTVTDYCICPHQLPKLAESTLKRNY